MNLNVGQPQHCDKHRPALAGCLECRLAKARWMREYRRQHGATTAVLVPTDLLTQAIAALDDLPVLAGRLGALL